MVVNAFNYLALLESPQIVRRLAPDMSAIARLDRSGLIVTMRGDGDYDFVSRYFAPAKGFPIRLPCRSTMLAPFWAGRLGKTSFARIRRPPRRRDNLSAGWRPRGTRGQLHLLPRGPGGNF